MEIEIRAKVKNLQKVKEKIDQVGATFISEKKIVDYYFGEIGLYEKIGHSFWIRIRSQDNKFELAYKGPTKEDGIYEEYEMLIPNIDTGIKIVTKMGLDNPITIKKTRETYKYKDISILVDTFKEKGTFLELERISDDNNKEPLIELLRELEIEEKDIFHKGYITLFLQEENSLFSKWIKN